MKIPDLNKYRKIYNIVICVFIVVFMVNVALTFIYKDRYRAKSIPGDTDPTISETADDSGEVSNDWKQVVLKDPNFERIIRYNLSIPETNNIVVRNVRKIDYLNLNHSNIKSLEGIENFKNLRKLDLSFNQVKDLTPLTKLKKIQEIILYSNNLEDVSELAKIKTLKKLDLSNNQITDVTPLAALINLTDLDLNNNKIYTIGSISVLPKLTVLDVSRNYIKDMNSLDSKKYKLLLDWGNKTN